MKRKHFMMAIALIAVLVLAGCQTNPVKSITKFTDANGKGERTIYVATFLDGSCQLSKSTTMTGDNWYVPEISKENPASIPCNTTADLVNTATTGGLVVPGNAEATVAQKWAAADQFIMGLSTTDFPITKRVIKSSNWSDDMMTNPALNADKTAYKAYVYMITYTWNNFDEYLTKTKALIGSEAWEISELKALEDENKKWATWTVEEKASTSGEGKSNFVTFTEHESVLYWSVYDRLLSFFESPNFNKTALGTEFDDYFFTLSDVEYYVGDNNFKAEITHKDDMDENGYVDIKVTAEFPIVEEAKSSPMIYIGIGLGVVALLSVVVVFLRRKK